MGIKLNQLKDPKLRERITKSMRAVYSSPRQLPHAQPERNKTAALDGAVERENEGMGRIVVRFTGYRVRPLDPDNFAGSVKDLLDGLRHSQLIPQDTPWVIALETLQEKVNHFTEEHTDIEIIWPENYQPC